MDFIPIDTDGGSQVVLELIYRLKVMDVMTRDVVSVLTSDNLRKIQELMRDQGITGIPIVDGKRLVGIVSLGVIIEALAGGWMNDSAEDRMTRGLIVLKADVPLRFAITYLNRYGYHRFSVRCFDYENASKASAELKKTLKVAGVDTAAVRRAAVASYELELNQVIHSYGGVHGVSGG